ncbi:tetratricopeptide repeat-containing sensor histidine kinase [Polaribacter sp.]|uniref:tetratricopeptide repeat-containing sensor histidine kinase n=1 Tax=Polaribacter sp. TaxID=1920175 RepID=UPI003F6C5349
MKQRIFFIGISLHLIIILGCHKSIQQKTNIQNPLRDSISELLKASKSKKYKKFEKLIFAKKALRFSNEIDNDSLWFASLNRITILQYSLNDLEDYQKDSKRYLDKAIIRNDSLEIAKGSYKLGSYYFRYAKYDSAYYYFNLAGLIFSKRGDSLEAGKNFLNMAIIQSNSADYYGSQQTSIRALKYLTYEKKKHYTLSVYNNLGIVSDELKLYTDAIFWFEKSLKIAKSDHQKIVLWNNMGLVYRKEEKYNKALAYFQKALGEQNINKFPSEKATLIDNIAYAYFLQGKKESILEMRKALELRKQQHNIRGEIVSNLHIGEYYFSNGNDSNARNYFKKALLDAKAIKDIKNTTKALFFLSKTVSNNSYIKRYAEIKDSLIARERLLKYQFASIELETNQQELRNVKLEEKVTAQTLNIERQQNRNILLFSITLALFVLLIIGFYYYRSQKRIQKQQLIIERLEARSNEKNRISMHLHDDIASDLLIGLQRGDFLLKKLQNSELESVMSFFDRAYFKMRKISQGLSSRYFAEIPFDKRIDKLCHEYSFNNDVRIVHNGVENIKWESISDPIQESIYSLLKEAFSNVFKHANATSINLSFNQLKKRLVIRIQDDGTGYIEEQTSGLGIFHMRKRVEELNGKFSIKNNELTSGTIIEISLYNSLQI